MKLKTLIPCTIVACAKRYAALKQVV